MSTNIENPQNLTSITTINTPNEESATGITCGREEASAEMISALSIHSPSSDPALAEDTQPFVSSLTSEQRAYILHL